MRTIGIVGQDLITTTRLAAAAGAAGRETIRVDRPADLPTGAGISLVLVDWGSREVGWEADLKGWLQREGSERQPRLVLFGPHADLAAHASARSAQLGPMLARSRLFNHLSDLLGKDV